MIGPRSACLSLGLLIVAVTAPATAGAPDADAAAAADAAPFTVQQVAPGVFVHFGRPLALDVPGHDDIANIGFIIGRRCVAVIDTGGSVRIGRALRTAIRAHTPRPVCYVINTHVHVDHVLGDFAFAPDHPSFVGHTALAAAIARNRRFFLSEYPHDLDQPPGTEQIIAPDRAVTDVLQLDLGARTLSLRAWPTAHTDCDLTVLDSTTGTLWAGDLLFRERLPAVDGDVKGWLTVLDELQHVGSRQVIPGHGPVAQDLATALEPERRYLRALLEDVHAAVDAGQSLEEAIDHVAESEKSHWLLWDSTHPRNVTRVYQQLEWQ